MKDERTLGEVVQHECGKHEAKPRSANRLSAEVPKIGIQRFAAGHREKYEAQRHKADPAVMAKEADRVDRVDRSKDVGIIKQMSASGTSKRQEP